MTLSSLIAKRSLAIDILLSFIICMPPEAVEAAESLLLRYGARKRSRHRLAARAFFIEE